MRIHGVMRVFVLTPAIGTIRYKVFSGDSILNCPIALRVCVDVGYS